MDCGDGQNVTTTVYASRVLPPIVWQGVILEELNLYANAEVNEHKNNDHFVIRGSLAWCKSDAHLLRGWQLLT